MTSALPITCRERKMLDERVKDKTYQATPIGHRVKHWLQALQWRRNVAFRGAVDGCL